MSFIVLIMKRKPIAQGIINSLGGKANIDLLYEPYYYKASVTIQEHNAKLALIEIAEAGSYDVKYCLALCKKLREYNPECKLILMCSEQDEKTIRQVVLAKGKKEIDDFVFFDVSIDYLASKLMST